MRITVRAPLLAVMFVSILAATQQTPPGKAVPASSQPAAITKPQKKTKPKRPTAEYWLQAADTFTSDIRDEDWRLAPLDKALLDARMCNAWWQANPLRARIWCAAAADAVSHKPQQESDDDRNARLIAAREVMRLVSALDSTLGKQVQDAIELASREVAGDGARSRDYLAMSLGAAAIEAEDPEQAARLISDSLRAGGAFQTITAVFKLGQRDAAQGDRSFSELLAFVRQTGNFSFANDLLREVFSPGRGVSAQWQQATVDTLREMAAVVPGSERDRAYRCRLLGTIITAGDTIPQASATAIRAVLADCETSLSLQQRDNPDLRQLKTVDDYLRAAAEAPNVQSRMVYKTTAAIRAEQVDHDCDRALDILDALTEEELRARPGMVPSLRMGIATRGAMYALEHARDIRSALHIAGRNPDNLRGSVELAVATQARAKGIREAIDMMQAAVRDLRRYRTDDPHDYVTLINLALPQKGDGALVTLRDMIRRIEGWEPLDRKALKPMERYFPPLESSLLPLSFASDIADLDLEAVAAISKSLRNAELRASYDLGVLQHLTKRYAEARRPARAGSVPAQ